MIIAIMGENKTGTSTLSLTFPKPLHHIDFDPGGFERAARRFNEELDSGAIQHTVYFTPLQAMREKIEGKTSMKPRIRLHGYKEQWYQMLSIYFDILEGSKKAGNGEMFKTVVFDTFTGVYELARDGYLQELQEAQKPDAQIRERLLQIEYGPINKRMKAIIDAASEVGRSREFHLVLVHHMTDVYEKKLVDGKIEEVKVGRDLAGWKSDKLNDLVHLILECKLEKNHDGSYVPTAKVALSGMGLGLYTMPAIQNPTWDKIAKLIK